MEPTVAALGGNSSARVFKRYFLATRPKFLTASILPVLYGTAIGFGASGAFDGLAFVLALAATVLVHAGANVINDVCDENTGNDGINEDRIYPFTGGSRFIQNGVLDVQQMSRWAWVLLAVGAFSGLMLAWAKGFEAIGFGLIGLSLGILYSAPPIRLSGRGFGEAAVAVGFGALPVAGAAWLQSGTVSETALLLSIPVSLWIAAVLLINEVPDRAADGGSGRKTLVVLFGLGGTRLIYLGLQFGAAVAAGWVAYVSMLPIWAPIVPVLTALASIKASAGITQPGAESADLRKGIEMTLMFHAVGTISLIVAVVVMNW